MDAAQGNQAGYRPDQEASGRAGEVGIRLGSLAAEGDGLRPAVLRLVSVLFGSGRLCPHHAADMLRAAEYEDIRVLPAVPGVPIGMIVGRRPAFQ